MWFAAPWTQRSLRCAQVKFIPIEAAVLFADVAGFTPLSERLALLGPLGAEELAEVLNNTFAALMAHIEAHGGIVARSAVTPLTAFFLRPPDSPPRQMATRALTCAQAMQRALAARQVAGQESGLSIKIGAAYGPAALLTVGDRTHGLEHLLAGAALDSGGGRRAPRPRGRSRGAFDDARLGRSPGDRRSAR